MITILRLLINIINWFVLKFEKKDNTIDELDDLELGYYEMNSLSVEEFVDIYENQEVLYMEEDSDDVIILKPSKNEGILVYYPQNKHAAVMVSNDVLHSKLDKVKLNQARIIGVV